MLWETSKPSRQRNNNLKNKEKWMTMSMSLELNRKLYMQKWSANNGWSQWKLATSISNYVSNGPPIYPKPQNKKLLLQKFLSNTRICPDLLDYILWTTNITLVWQKVLIKMSKSLKEVKRSKFNLELANKHCFLSTTIHVGPSSSMKGKF